MHLLQKHCSKGAAKFRGQFLAYLPSHFLISFQASPVSSSTMASALVMEEERSNLSFAAWFTTGTSKTQGRGRGKMSSAIPALVLLDVQFPPCAEVILKDSSSARELDLIRLLSFPTPFILQSPQKSSGIHGLENSPTI